METNQEKNVTVVFKAPDDLMAALEQIAESLDKLVESKETERILEKAREEAEATEEPKPGDWGWFWDHNPETDSFGKLESVYSGTDFPYGIEGGVFFKNFSKTPPKELSERLAKGGWKLEKI